jgi:uncharacterized protein
MQYHAPRWLPGGNLQTIWPALVARRGEGAAVQFKRERWTSPDADFIDVDRVPAHETPSKGTSAQSAHTLLVMFHGLEGSSNSHYSQAFAQYARERGLAFAIPHFRGCSGELNAGPRAYHSGDFEEIGWILARFRQEHVGPIVAVGVSMGGNALLRWAQEMGVLAGHALNALAAVSAPIDLRASGMAIGRGFNRLVYTRMFMKTMVPKALKKLEQHPGLFDRSAMLAARDLYEFDNLFTAPLHGFKNTEDYWCRASTKPHLHRLHIPTLIVNAKNDPFVPAWSLPAPSEIKAPVTLWQPAQGGHVGFAQGAFPGHVQAMPNAVGDWLLQHAQNEADSRG